MLRELWWQLFICAAGISIGWTAHDWRSAKLALAASDQAEQTRQLVTEITRQSGQELEAKIAELKANENHTEREIRTEIIKPVFSNICATDDYVRLFNENVDKAGRVMAGKPADPVSGQPAKADGHNRY
ncbi:hypothetical protein [Erwinia pyrifoliae]|uniref:Uncharacterized protein n=1 Tax=Erwinia pyrifoliae TaxID=79967 RepID=A0ABY5XDP1_ERWPY|nr:hypothetical protein [Erwinia pyrifoliae]MCT2387301.1 hypothetical protein [Erwinia pyrifoliae]MCU8587099.1 hypothetical protein [Erwinia pyrifoliae]UWS30962.1 hypothetical protein NYP81_05760 [Erwinia pyrifoliae]UWS35240.1 hypothetical protein NYP84_08920 [Erwinia pyrifoliae]